MRLDLLRACVKQARAEEVETEIAKLMTSYPSLRGSSEIDAKAMVYQYAEALAGVPLWAIREACKAIARGAVPLALFGASGYGRLMGRLAGPFLLVQAAAPFIMAFMIERTSDLGALSLAAGFALVALVCFILIRRPA